MDGFKLLRFRVELIEPQQRLALREHPLITAGVLADLLGRTLALNYDLHYGLGFDRYHGMARPRAVALARDTAQELARELDRRAALGRQSRDLAHEIVALLEPTYAAVDRAVSVGRMLAGTLAETIANCLQQRRRIPTVAVGALTRAVARGDSVRALVGAGQLVEALSTQIAELVGLGEADQLDLVLLSDLLDDFTRADLSTADLTGVDLAGVRWSELHTCWPEDLDIERLKEDSREIPPGSGIYIVEPGAETAYVIRV
ncbi:hypothetical protein [Kitasatospora kazusensis]|uniref:hypothetical protein n=1 Tax=Kitasatospora kazusensis TaxID=407974 RepID=UPI0031E1E95D